MVRDLFTVELRRAYRAAPACLTVVTVLSREGWLLAALVEVAVLLAVAR